MPRSNQPRNAPPAADRNRIPADAASDSRTEPMAGPDQSGRADPDVDGEPAAALWLYDYYNCLDEDE